MPAPGPLMNRAFLDQLRCAGGCCASQPGALWLSGECHAGAPADVLIAGDHVHLSCGACQRPFAVVAVAATVEMPRRRCHPAAPADVIYERGVLLLRCSACEATVAEMEVAP